MGQSKRSSIKHTPIIAHDKQRGEWAELRFMAHAAEHGLKINKPWGESSPYDFVIGSGRKLARVQVKSTTCFSDGRYVCKTANNAGLYDADEFDFVAAYVIPEDVWYIIPEPEIRGRRNIYLRPQGAGKYGQYREAWELLRQATGVAAVEGDDAESEPSPAEPAPYKSHPMHKALLHVSGELRKIRERQLAAWRAMQPPSEKPRE